MAKIQKRFVCSNCGGESSSWSGKCQFCDEWNTIVEEIIDNSIPSKSITTLNIEKLNSATKHTEKRLQVKFGELDRIFGGGLVPSSVVLFVGEPGIGKSTLLMQICGAVAQQNNTVLYVSGEESTRQVGLRAKRLGVIDDNINLAASNSVDEVANAIAKNKYSLVVVDSIQTMCRNGVSSQPGSISQINSSTHMLMNTVKQTNTALIIVGHVTKDGSIAGPKVLEHIVDAVFQLEGDRYGGFKMLRSYKNRFGSTNETVLFEMKDFGLAPIENPSKALLNERQVVDGSVVLASIEGTRPILVEVQALVNTTSYGYPRRAASGVDINRLNVLVAMLEKRTKLNLSNKDIYVNIVGGIKIQEPAVDLAICMAIGSAAKGLVLNKNAVVFGEVGLSGDIRRVLHSTQRINEAKKLGFTNAIGPPLVDQKSTFLLPVSNIKDAMNLFLK